MESQKKISTKVTPEQIQEFWNNSINPITGFRTNKTDRYTIGEKAEMKYALDMNKKFNKE